MRACCCSFLAVLCIIFSLSHSDRAQPTFSSTCFSKLLLLPFPLPPSTTFPPPPPLPTLLANSHPLSPHLCPPSYLCFTSPSPLPPSTTFPPPPPSQISWPTPTPSPHHTTRPSPADPPPAPTEVAKEGGGGQPLPPSLPPLPPSRPRWPCARA